jgi:DNA polymerase-1
MLRLLFDIESDGLLNAEDDKPAATKVHCIVIRDLDTDQQLSVHGEENARALELLAQADELCGHNILTYDLPLLEKLHGFKPKDGCVVFDTLVVSRLIWTDIGDVDYQTAGRTGMPNNLIGRHSLEAWGYRLGCKKIEYTDWSMWTPMMQTRCEVDVDLNVRLRRKIDSKNYSHEAIRIEHDFQQAIFLQEQTGFHFDSAFAQQVYSQMAAKRDEIVRKLQEVFPPTIETLKTPAYYEGYVVGCLEQKRFTTKGECQKNRLRDINPGPMRTKSHPFNPNSNQQIADRLGEKYGWKPVAFTKTGQPQINDEILSDLPFPEAALLTEYFILAKRIGTLAEGDQAWLKHIQPDGRIYGGVTTGGAVTGRCTHSLVVNVPKEPQPWGKEMRSCFVATPGWWMVGADAVSLEACCQAHFMHKYDKGLMVEVVLRGDKTKGTNLHQVNAKAMGLEWQLKANYECAKKWYYAFIYGSGAFKSGLIIEQVSACPLTEAMVTQYNAEVDGRTLAYAKKWLAKEHIPATPKNIAIFVRGGQMKNTFLTASPALAALIEDIQGEAESNGTWVLSRAGRKLVGAYLTGLDGRRLNVRSLHSALNTLLQSAGAVVMKKALCILMDKLKARGWRYGIDFRLLSNMHDEIQAECPTKEQAHEFGRLACDSIAEAGQHFKFNCPLAGEHKVGKNWHETH